MMIYTYYNLFNTWERQWRFKLRLLQSWWFIHIIISSTHGNASDDSNCGCFKL